MQYTVTTTMQPDVELTVDEAEALDLGTQGLLASMEPIEGSEPDRVTALDPAKVRAEVAAARAEEQAAATAAPTAEELAANTTTPSTDTTKASQAKAATTDATSGADTTKG